MAIELLDEDLEQIDYDSQDMLNRCHESVQHRLFPIQSNWKLEDSEQFKFFIENNE